MRMNIVRTQIDNRRNGQARVTFWFGTINDVGGIQPVEGSRDEARAFAKWARNQGYNAKAHYNFVEV